ncbi:MAG: DUF6089 family protein [Paludibacter sp.]|nr:DUF6089 family protein [Paludibacter sp.]
MKLIRLLIFSVFVLIAVQLSAQDVYRAEIGINGGGSYYLGEGNKTLSTNIQPAFSGFLRYRFDPRFAARIELTSATAAGTGFKNPVFATDLCGEFNFFDFEKNQYKRFSKTFTPYIFAGIGMMSYKSDSSGIAPSIPFGVGMKVKLGDRFNLNLQWATRLLLADNLENIPSMNNPSRLNGTNILNNDLLSTFTVGISFDFWKKECDCQNASVRKDSHKYKKK